MKVLVTGGDGLVGSSLKRQNTDFEIVSVNRKDADLTSRHDVEAIFKRVKPDYVIHTAARVGGIGRNIATPAQQYTDNILMNTHVIDEACKNGVKKLIAFSSVCAFPADTELISENNLHNGQPFAAHGAYAYSKRMVDVQIDAYRKQYGINYCSLIPGNIFGESDNFNLQDGHVVPSLVHKAYLAKKNNQHLTVWGDGSPQREFIYVDDLSRACLALLKKDDLPQRLLVSGLELSIKQLVEIIVKYSNVSGIDWDKSKPNGQMFRRTDKTLFLKELPEFQMTSIDEGIKRTVNWFSENFDTARK